MQGQSLGYFGIINYANKNCFHYGGGVCFKRRLQAVRVSPGLEYSMGPVAT